MLSALVFLLIVADPSITGRVTDASGGAIVGALVVVKSGSGQEQTVTGPDGHFAIDKAPSGSATMTVRAAGFAEKVMPLSAMHDIEVVLSPATILETVTVTPSRGEQRLADVSASVERHRQGRRQRVARSRRRRCAAPDSDVQLVHAGQQPLVASDVAGRLASRHRAERCQPDARADRWDPRKRPVRGWVYWTRVPLESVDRIEVVDGPSSSLYGNYAMGGVINILTAHPERRTIEVKPQVPVIATAPRSIFLAATCGESSGSRSRAACSIPTDFPSWPRASGAPWTTTPPSNIENVNVKLDYSPGSRVTSFLRTGDFHESRNNGKHSSTDGVGAPEANDTTWRFVNGGTRLDLPGGNAVQASAFSNFETFHSNFLAVPAVTPARSIARNTLNQTVPTHDVGGMVQWSRAFGSKNFVTAGSDLHWVTGESQEDGLDAVTGTHVVLHRVSGGTQQSAGAYVQDTVTPLSKLTIMLAARVDHFANYNAHNLENTVSGGVLGPPTVNNNPDLPGADRDGRHAARGRGLSPDRPRQHLGGRQFGVPCADAQRALSPVQEGDHHDARQLRARAGAARGR